MYGIPIGNHIGNPYRKSIYGENNDSENSVNFASSNIYIMNFFRYIPRDEIKKKNKEEVLKKKPKNKSSKIKNKSSKIKNKSSKIKNIKKIY